MSNSFASDLVVTLIGAFVGSALTVVIAGVTFLLGRRFRETQALNLLIDELHRRRALTAIDSPVSISDAEHSDDYVRVNASILTVKDLIRETRALTRPIRTVRHPLSQMTSACNRYLERAERDPDRYWFFLVQLREEIGAEIASLARKRRSVVFLEPGAGSL